MITDFINGLSQFYHYENDLSNITKIMCDSSLFFKEHFIHFFFPDIDISQIKEVIRERTDSNDGDSRVDLYLQMQNDDMPYLIEVKINDTNHHFGQYEHSYNVPKERLGYITNYELRQEGYDVKTWTEFYDYISKVNEANREDKDLVTGYIKYLKSTCSIIKFTKPMKLQYLFSLYEFFNILPVLFRKDKDNYELKDGRIYEAQLKKGILAFDFYLKPLVYEANYSFYGQFDIYFEREEPLITMFIQDCKEYKNVISKILRSTWQESQLFEEPRVCPDVWGNNGIWFDMKSEVFAKIQEMKSIDEQKRMLESFIEEVINAFLSKAQESIS